MSHVQPTDFLRLPSVIEQTGLARSSIYRRINDGDFPRPVRLSQRAIGWSRHSIETWKLSRLVATNKR